jgi:hypothetical protein
MLMTMRNEMMVSILRLGLFFGLGFVVAGCPLLDDEQDTGEEPDGGIGELEDGGVNFPPADGTIAIYLDGDSSPRSFSDGLSGQTPTDYFIGVSKYYAMTASDDPTPALCFDHGSQVVEADMHRSNNLVGSCPTDALPYTHGRVKVDWVRYTVEGVLHSGGYSLPGSFTLFRAYSDTTYDGTPFQAGQGLVLFSGATEVEAAVSYDHIPDLPGLIPETIGGELWLTFPFSRPLGVVNGHPGAYWARFIWEIYEGFRWEDRASADYKVDIWDVGTTVETTEDVVFTGATGYRTTASTD